MSNPDDTVSADDVAKYIMDKGAEELRAKQLISCPEIFGPWQSIIFTDCNKCGCELIAIWSGDVSILIEKETNYIHDQQACVRNRK